MLDKAGLKEGRLLPSPSMGFRRMPALLSPAAPPAPPRASSVRGSSVRGDGAGAGAPPSPPAPGTGTSVEKGCLPVLDSPAEAPEALGNRVEGPSSWYLYMRPGIVNTRQQGAVDTAQGACSSDGDHEPRYVDSTAKRPLGSCQPPSPPHPNVRLPPPPTPPPPTQRHPLPNLGALDVEYRRSSSSAGAER